MRRSVLVSMVVVLVLMAASVGLAAFGRAVALGGAGRDENDLAAGQGAGSGPGEVDDVGGQVVDGEYLRGAGAGLDVADAVVDGGEGPECAFDVGRDVVVSVAQTDDVGFAVWFSAGFDDGGEGLAEDAQAFTPAGDEFGQERSERVLRVVRRVWHGSLFLTGFLPALAVC